MDLFGLVVTVLVTAGVVVAILLFEKRRADRITGDTRRMASGDRESPDGATDVGEGPVP